MSLLETILSAQGGNLVKQLANTNGIDPESALNVLGKLVPGLTQQLKNNTQQPTGLESLLKAIQSGNHQRYIESDQDAFTSSARNEGNAILGHLLGSKDRSRAMAAEVASETGIGDSIIKKMLPQVANLVMGAMSNQTRSGGALGDVLNMLGGGQQKQATSLLTSFLDRDNDGSIIDDVMGMAARALMR
jgi:hypothetical protein